MFREKRERGVTRLTGNPALQFYPVGAIYFSDRLVDPAALFGGTWARFAIGRMLIGVNEADVDFDAPLEVGGAKTHTLSGAETPAHTHNVGTLTTNSTGSSHDHAVNRRAAAGTVGGVAMGSGLNQADGQTGTGGSAHTHNVTGDTGGVVGGDGQPHNNMPPFIAVYMWRRTA